tara:strand:+ start:29171 stop:31036 length:1866 start_codon:yes stop_codon:yes gene_type:complete
MKQYIGSISPEEMAKIIAADASSKTQKGSISRDEMEAIRTAEEPKEEEEAGWVGPLRSAGAVLQGPRWEGLARSLLEGKDYEEERKKALSKQQKFEKEHEWQSLLGEIGGDMAVGAILGASVGALGGPLAVPLAGIMAFVNAGRKLPRRVAQFGMVLKAAEKSPKLAHAAKKILPIMEKFFPMYLKGAAVDAATSTSKAIAKERDILPDVAASVGMGALGSTAGQLGKAAWRGGKSAFLKGTGSIPKKQADREFARKMLNTKEGQEVWSAAEGKTRGELVEEALGQYEGLSEKLKATSTPITKILQKEKDFKAEEVLKTYDELIAQNKARSHGRPEMLERRREIDKYLKEERARYLPKERLSSILDKHGNKTKQTIPGEDVPQALVREKQLEAQAKAAYKGLDRKTAAELAGGDVDRGLRRLLGAGDLPQAELSKFGKFMQEVNQPLGAMRGALESELLDSRSRFKGAFNEGRDFDPKRAEDTFGRLAKFTETPDLLEQANAQKLITNMKESPEKARAYIKSLSRLAKSGLLVGAGAANPTVLIFAGLSVMGAKTLENYLKRRGYKDAISLIRGVAMEEPEGLFSGIVRAARAGTRLGLPSTINQKIIDRMNRDLKEDRYE